MRIQPQMASLRVSLAIATITLFSIHPERLANADDLPLEAPVGTVLAFAGVYEESLGPGWLICRGQSLRRTDFPELFRSLGTAWGQGDDPGRTFQLPDLRGRFLRGVAHGAPCAPDRDRRFSISGGNAGDSVGSFQRDATALPKSSFALSSAGIHTHRTVITKEHERYEQRIEGGLAGAVATTQPEATRAFRSEPNGSHSHDVSGGDLETRPVNAAVNWIVKARATRASVPERTSLLKSLPPQTIEATLAPLSFEGGLHSLLLEDLAPEVRFGFLGNEHDSCGHKRLIVQTTSGVVEIGKGESRAIPVPSHRFWWYCGGSREWTTAPAGTDTVVVYRASTGRDITWACYRTQ